MLPVSRDTLLRIVRRLTPAKAGPIQGVGIDEWAWRRRQRHGTIPCDLERRCILDLLPDRDQSTVMTWLRTHPEVEVDARDRAGGFAGAVTAAAPHAIQVADRWHLMENASAASLDAVRADLGVIRRALDSGAVNPALLSAAERVQYESYLRRREANDAIRAMAGAGIPIKEIVRRTGRSRTLVRGDVGRRRSPSGAADQDHRTSHAGRAREPRAGRGGDGGSHRGRRPGAGHGTRSGRALPPDAAQRNLRGVDRLEPGNEILRADHAKEGAVRPSPTVSPGDRCAIAAGKPSWRTRPAQLRQGLARSVQT